jgi:RHS repeat-associated protein
LWPLRSIEDAAGNGIDLAWDEQGRIKGLRQKHEKRTLAVAYAPDGRIASIAFHSPNGKQQILARYGYDAKGRFASAQDAMGYAERYEYDASGRVSREIAKDGGVFTFKYDDLGRCVRTSGQDNYDLKILRYFDHVRMTEVTNSLGKTTRYQWLATGQITMELDPLGGKTETEYDEFGRILSKTYPMGQKTTFGYDAEGNRCKLLDPLGNETVFEYNHRHQVVRQIDPDGGVWEKFYDSSNRPIAAIDPLGNRSAIVYDPTGNPVQLRKANGASSKRVFSESGNLIEIIGWEGGKTVLSHDEFGRVVMRRDPGGQESIRKYDLLGRVIEVSYDYGKTVKFQYDAGGNVLSVRSTSEEPVTFSYGACRRLLEKKSGGGQSTFFAWGSEPDRLEKVINPLGESYIFQYDDCGRVAAEVGFDGRKTTFKYDLSGRCIGRRNNLGQSIEWRRDAMGHVVEETLAGEESTIYQFDKTGNLISAGNDWSSIKLTRDAAGRVIEEDQNGFNLSREFGPSGEILSLFSDLGAHFKYSYDGNGFLTSVDANGLGTYSYSRNVDGRVSSVSLPGDATWAQDFDSRGRLLRQTVSAQSDVELLVDRQFAYDDANMLLASIDSHWGKCQYFHDASMRLTQFSSDDSRKAYSLNAAGDPISVSVDGSLESVFKYGPGGTLLSQGNIEYEYDGAGRLVSKIDRRESNSTRRWTYAWDAKDRLRSLKTPESESWEYCYDPFGRRCLKKGATREIRFIWDKDVLLHELEAGKETRTWGFEPYGFKPIFKIEGDALYSIIVDPLGAPREMIDGKSRIIWSVKFDPWGKPLHGKGELEGCPFRLQGQYFDAESGLHYNRYRYYDPTNGRFISRDPILLAGGMSSYQYTPNPTYWVDPLGLCPTEEEAAEKEKLYRAMSPEDFAIFKETGRMPGTGETSTSPNREFSEDYRGVLVEFELKPGTIAQLEAIGVTDTAPATREKYPDMPIGEKGWNQTNARFKEENGQTNIQLGKGDALDIFNDNITGHNVLRPG